MSDLDFYAVARFTLREYWPVFALGAALEFWVVGRIRRSGRFAVRWIAWTGIVAAGLVAALWAESFLAIQFAYQTEGEGARPPHGEALIAHLERSWPILVPLGGVLIVLARRPRSEVAIAGLVAVAGVLASVIPAMWLVTTNHQPLVFQLLVVPGGLGFVASVVGFTAVTATWMAIGRWIWHEGRRRRRPPVPPDPLRVLGEPAIDVRPAEREDGD